MVFVTLLLYAAARAAWRDPKTYPMNSKVGVVRGRWHKNAQMLDEARLKAIEVDSNNSSTVHLIESPYSIMPRRLWDLKSNRVVDFRMLHAAQLTIENRPISIWGCDPQLD